MKKLILTIILGLILNYINSQVIYQTNYENQADIIVFITPYESQADLIVYRVNSQTHARGNNGLWFFTNIETHSHKNIFITNFESQANLRIFFTNFETQVGWKNINKIYLLK